MGELVGTITPYRIVLADDYAVVRAGVRALLADEPDLSVVGEAANSDEAAQLCAELQPDILLFDLKIPGTTPAETLASLQEQSPTTRVVILTAQHDAAAARSLIALGVAGYVLHDDPPEALVQAVRVALTGGAWLNQSILAALADEPSIATVPPSAADLPSPHLSGREREVLTLLADEARELTYAEIGRALNIGPATVKTYLQRLAAKLGTPPGGRRAVVRAARERYIMHQVPPGAK